MPIDVALWNPPPTRTASAAVWAGHSRSPRPNAQGVVAQINDRCRAPTDSFIHVTELDAVVTPPGPVRHEAAANHRDA